MSPKIDPEITIPFKSVGVLESPNEDKVIIYHLYVNANDVPAVLPSEGKEKFLTINIGMVAFMIMHYMV